MGRVLRGMPLGAWRRGEGKLEPSFGVSSGGVSAV
jgi:hypothetical protein